MSLNLAITRRCNETCPHCYVNAGSRDGGETELSLSEWKKIIDQASEWGFHHIHIFGGEPFLVPFLGELCSYISDRGLPYNIATNGTLLEDEDFNWLISSMGSLIVSVHGLDAFHNDFARHSTSFKKVRDLVVKSRERLVDISVATCLMKKNVGQYLETVEYFARLGVSTFFALHFSPIGRGLDLINEMIPPGQWYRLFQALKNELPQLRRRVGRNVEILYELATYPSEDKMALHYNHLAHPCSLPQAPPLVVDWVGRVYPCILLLNDPDWLLGDLRRDPLEEIMGELTKEWVTDRVRGVECREGCNFYFVCQGGCFAYRQGMLKDYRCGGEKKYIPFCPLRPIRL